MSRDRFSYKSVHIHHHSYTLSNNCPKKERPIELEYRNSHDLTLYFIGIKLYIKKKLVDAFNDVVKYS